LLVRHALTITVAATSLAGCGALQSPVGAPGASPQGNVGRTSSYEVLYRFDDYPDGLQPAAGLSDVGGRLYGTASRGGQKGCHGTGGCGTVYSITTKGSEKLLFTFDVQAGVFPKSRLIDVKGTLYGTTFQGGPGTRGTVYSISTSGTETLLHSFSGNQDGGLPVAGLVDAKGTLYGTTAYGGTKQTPLTVGIPSTTPLSVPQCCGTVYSIGASGTHTVLHRFKGGRDGATPYGGLTDVNGTLYGTTANGGGQTKGGCCGTVYSISTSGAEKVLYRFKGGSDGTAPQGDLIGVDGTLYGTTVIGGGSGCDDSHGCGTVYSVTTSGNEKVLYRFAGTPDGANPQAGLIAVNGTLYGTTMFGGGAGCFGGEGCGTVYSVNTAGTESVLYSFAGGSDGMYPVARLVAVKGKLYGTTSLGGDGRSKPPNCCGTIFTLSP
jgi:uncharacterized repeat protein (TIGR03803 family)